MVVILNLAMLCSPLRWSVRYDVAVATPCFGVFSAPLWPTIKDLKHKHKLNMFSMIASTKTPLFTQREFITEIFVILLLC